VRGKNLPAKKRRRRQLTPDTFGFGTQKPITPLQSVAEGVRGRGWESLAQQERRLIYDFLRWLA
jgi:hypothetical protein